MTAQAIAARTLAPSAGQVYRVIGDLVTFKAVGDETGGAYSLFETCTAPHLGTPPHLHHYEDESFYILEGTYGFQIGDEQVVLGPGGYAFAPRGTPHAYRNIGETPARMLIMETPGGIHERFFTEVGDLVTDPADAQAPAGPSDLGRIIAAAAKYGIELLLPGVPVD